MLIGHASIDENRTVKGGKAGDQTGKEVCVRSWYKKPWHTVLRAKDPKVAERMAKVCEFICKDNFNVVGYDQNQRNTLRNELVKVSWNVLALKTPCETDCSAFMSVCAEAAGVAMYAQYSYGNAPTTANMVDKFYATGMFDILKDKCYIADEKHLKRGDILVGKGHTAMALEDGPVQYDRPVLSLGSKGAHVQVLQGKLIMRGYRITCDGDFGPNTLQAVISFQGEQGLVKDGIVGSKTYNKLF